MVFGTWYVVYAIGLLLIGINITQASSEMEVLDPKFSIFCQKFLNAGLLIYLELCPTPAPILRYYY